MIDTGSVNHESGWFCINGLQGQYELCNTELLMATSFWTYSDML